MKQVFLCVCTGTIRESGCRREPILLHSVHLPASEPVAAGLLPPLYTRKATGRNIGWLLSATKHQYLHPENTVGQVYFRCQGVSLLNMPLVPLVIYHLPVQAQCTQITTPCHPNSI